MKKTLNFLVIYLYLSSIIVNSLVLKKEHEHLRKEVIDILNLGPDVYHKMSPLVFIGIVERDGQFDAAEFIKEYKRVEKLEFSYDHSEETIQMLKEKYPEHANTFDKTLNKRLLLEDSSYAEIIKTLNEQIEQASNHDIEEIREKINKHLKDSNYFQNKENFNLKKEYNDEEFEKLSSKFQSDEETIKLFEKFFIRSDEKDIKGRKLRLDENFDQIFPVPIGIFLLPLAARVPPGTISNIPSTYFNSKMLDPIIQCTISCPNYTNPFWFWNDPVNVLNFYFVTFNVIASRFSFLFNGPNVHFAIRPNYKFAQWGNLNQTMWYQSCTDFQNSAGATIYRLSYWNQRECDYVPPYPVMYCTCDFGEIFNQIACCPDEYNCLHSMDGGTLKRYGYCYPSIATRQKLAQQGVYVDPIVYSSTSNTVSRYYSYGRVPPEILNSLNNPAQWSNWQDFFPTDIDTTKLWWFQVLMKWFRDPNPLIPNSAEIFAY